MKLGHEVQVLTGFPNYPTGKIYDGYKIKFLQREEMDGVSVIRVPLYPSHNSSSISRIANYTSFAFFASAIGPWVVNKADIAYVYHPPPTVYLPAAFIQLIRGIPAVYDIQDFWPDSLAASGMFNSKLGLWLVDKYCRVFYKIPRKIVVLSPGFKKKLQDKGIPEDKIEVIYNWADASVGQTIKEDQDLSRKLGMEGRFNIMFAGNIGKMQGLNTVLEAAEFLQSKCPKIQFVLVGEGLEVENLKRRKEEMKLNNVLFIPRQPISEIGKIMCLADVFLVHLIDDPLFRITIPSKIQTYLAFGKPILVGVCGDAADLVNQAQAGISFHPQNPSSLVESVMKITSVSPQSLKKMGENGKSFYQTNMSLPTAAKRFESLFQSLI
jgi:glycosyltransferase involved in cell wall biosynthesis